VFYRKVLIDLSITLSEFTSGTVY